MSSLRRALSRALALFRDQASADRDLRAAMQVHVDMATDENIRRGMTPGEARRQAMQQAGTFTQAIENVREQRSLPWIEKFAADTRYALRHFRRTPLVTVTMLLVLSLGIGSNVVLFTVLNSLATMPAPGIVRDVSLVRIRGTLHMKRLTDEQSRLMSWPEVQEFGAHADIFSSVAAYTEEPAVVNIGDISAAPLTATLIYTTANYYNTLGIRPALGVEPPIDAGSVRLTSPPTVMISYAMWQQQFGGAREVIGRTIRVNDIPIEIVGVAPPRFNGTTGKSGLTIWVPLAAYPVLQKRAVATFASYDSMFLSAVARLQRGVTPKSATPLVARVAQNAFQQVSRGSAAHVAGGDMPLAESADEVIGGADVVPMLASNSRISARADLLASGAAAVAFALLVLLITCTNVSALMVGVSVARRREIGIRLSLGGPRKRLIRQLLTESVLLSLVAAAVGLIVTTVGIRILAASLADVQLVVDWRVTIATCAVAVLTGMVFGVSPALHATRVSLGEVLKSSSVSIAATRSWLQRALVVLQITLTQPLLLALGVVIATLVADAGSPSTFGMRDRIAEIELDTWSGRVSNAARAARIAAAVKRVASMPGVVSAMPMQMGTASAALEVPTSDRVAGIAYDARMISQLTAAPKGYFDAFNIPFVRGREFNASEYARTTDDPSRPMQIDAVIIGSDLARKLWGSTDALGRRFLMPVANGAAPVPLTVVGIVDAAATGPSSVNGQLRVFVPYSPMNTGVIARTAGPALPMLSEMRKLVAAEAPEMAVSRVQTMQQHEQEVRRSLVRTSGAVAGGGLLALLLSAIGLYAVVSLVVGQRSREIGIRSALGAPRGQVVRMFFMQGLTLSLIGLALGLPLSMLVPRLVVAKLNWPLTNSPMIGVATGAVVLVVASVAVWIPARRASSIDPLIALRME